MAKEFIVYSKTKAEFEAKVASGEVDYTQMGIIAETGEMWWNGVYRPITKTTSFAKDLTGRIEAKPEEFIFRPSAGTKSIRDESAVIRRIKGNTSVWGQLLGEMNADNWVSYSSANTSIDYNDDSCTLTLLNSNAVNPYQISCKHALTNSVIVGHKYLCAFECKTSISPSQTAGAFAVEMGGGSYIMSPSITTAERWTIVSGLLNPLEVKVNFLIKPPWEYINKGVIGDNFSIRNVQLFDLTQIFGAGNEPTTLEEFKELYPESYYPYCEREVRSMRATGIETIGANAFNKDGVVGGKLNADGSVTTNDKYSVAKIEVVPYEKYTLTNVANAYNSGFTYALYDSNDTFLSIGQLTYSSATVVTRTGDVTMPMNARYMRVVVYNDYLDSCCVNLKHSGTLTAEEATYFKEVRMLPDIAKYFPEGMHGIGDVFDEINEENVVKRFGVVDLGSINDYSFSGGAFRSFALKDLMSRTPTTTDYNENMICVGYDTFRGTQSLYKIEFTTNSGALWINNPDYTDVDAFKTAMSGVLLYYELAEPIVTPVTEPLQWDYKVADFGTEKMLSTLPSSPFRADIVYQFNAEGRIRDNSRNIERLEEHTKNMATMDDVINAIPTEVATATQRNVIVSGTSFLFLPNILYEYEQSIGEYTIPELVGGNSSYDNVWMLRVSVASSSTLTIPFDVVWENNQAPSFASGAIIELRFRKLADGRIIGDWKIYR